MSNEEWQQVVEEFGDRAYERFTRRGAPHINAQCDLQSNQDFVDYDLQDIKLKPLYKLLQHGIAVYGFEAEKQMWEFKGFGGDWQDIPNVARYSVLKRNIKEFPDRHRRKTSAALPFDLERAKAGDVVDGKLSSDIDIDNPTDLRMKYPKKRI
jgi:hypothetical protein